MWFNRKNNLSPSVIFIGKKKYPAFFNNELNKRYYNKHDAIKEISFESGMKLFYRFLKYNESFNLYLNEYKEGGCLYYHSFVKYTHSNFHTPFDLIVKKMIARSESGYDIDVGKLKKFFQLRKEWNDILSSIGLIVKP